VILTQRGTRLRRNYEECSVFDLATNWKNISRRHKADIDDFVNSLNITCDPFAAVCPNEKTAISKDSGKDRDGELR